jgi:Membrane bound FAD containing D-sorbitol dehydrogenase
MTEISRRALIRGATVTAATAAFGSMLISPSSLIAQGSPTAAVDPDAIAKTQFRDLSAALTGVDPSILVPNVDPLRMNGEVFDKAKTADANTLQTILSKFSGTAGSPPKTVAQILAEDAKDESAKFLMRSIILAWYLGAWYAPQELKKNSYAAKDPQHYYYSTRRYSKEVLIPHDVISANAYTNSLVWRVAQAHPMGYSNLQFGYWGQEPPDAEMFTKPLPKDPPDAEPPKAVSK